MPDYDNSMRGVLFKNDKASDNPNAPAYKGNGEVNGVEVWLSAWVKKSKNGVSYMSLSFENKEDQVAATPVASDVPIDAVHQPAVADDDDIPF